MVAPPRLCRLDGGHDRVDRGRKPPPARRLVRELSFTGAREMVELRLAIVLRCPPLGGDPASILEAMQRGVERALVHLQDIARDLLNPLGYPPAVHGLKGERFQDEHVERALEDVV